MTEKTANAFTLSAFAKDFKPSTECLTCISNSENLFCFGNKCIGKDSHLKSCIKCYNKFCRKQRYDNGFCFVCKDNTIKLLDHSELNEVVRISKQIKRRRGDNYDMDFNSFNFTYDPDIWSVEMLGDYYLKLVQEALKFYRREPVEDHHIHAKNFIDFMDRGRENNPYLTNDFLIMCYDTNGVLRWLREENPFTDYLTEYAYLLDTCYSDIFDDENTEEYFNDFWSEVLTKFFNNYEVQDLLREYIDEYGQITDSYKLHELFEYYNAYRLRSYQTSYLKFIVHFQHAIYDAIEHERPKLIQKIKNLYDNQTGVKAEFNLLNLYEEVQDHVRERIDLYISDEWDTGDDRGIIKITSSFNLPLLTMVSEGMENLGSDPSVDNLRQAFYYCLQSNIFDTYNDFIFQSPEIEIEDLKHDAILLRFP